MSRVNQEGINKCSSSDKEKQAMREPVRGSESGKQGVKNMAQNMNKKRD